MGKRKRHKDDTVHPHSSVSQKFSEEHNVGEGNDIISSLPENVLLHILSFLSTKDAIRTSILSRKWEYLWTSISIIELDGAYPLAAKKKKRHLLDFVERVLLLHDASDIKILILVLYKRVNSSRLSSWICALIRHNIEELDLSLHWNTQPILPCCLFTCQSLVVLKLSMYWSLKVPSVTHFSKLKTLELSNVTFPDDNSTQHLFSSCPVLQELGLVNCGWKNLKTITICIPTLKKLQIENELMRSEDVVSCVTKIYATNLIHLDCFNCLIVDFHLHDLSSLVDASICSYDYMLEQDLVPRVLRLLTGIFNVTKLSTTSEMVEYLTPVENLLDRLPTFYNMTHLVLNSEFCGHHSIGVLMDLLEKSPKLEFLNFDQGFDPFDEDDWMSRRVPSCFASSLKTVRIADFDEKPVEMQFIRFLLKNATILESLTLCSNSEDMKEKQQRKERKVQLNNLPRGSKSCVIKLIWS
ncbi:hypothetical protein Vadar_019032 [Vaccinium darrowii]|uniref:Uncharacterized protein n=1 Tax=Vaccinium darrowii TaxID=229202 RepID=A0ACB7XRP1_9ERIC|nr:hypothetical protein Vadar_019032 [Vaccinium darrowii]